MLSIIKKRVENIQSKQLYTVLHKNPFLFKRIFLDGKEIKLDNHKNIRILKELELIKEIDNAYQANVRIYHLKDKFILTDFPFQRDFDKVFPIYDDESAYFAKHLNVKTNDIVLDLCTGSGILAIFAAEKAKKVYATDINDKALRYAKFNAKLNGIKNKIIFSKGDLYQPVKGNKFDLIIANPPFVPVPPSVSLSLYADGGATGLDIAKRILEGVNQHLNENGRFQMITLSLGDENKPFEIIDHINCCLKSMRRKAILTYLYKDSMLIDPNFTDLYKNYPGFNEWRRYLKKNKLTHQYYIFIDIIPSKELFSVIEERQKPTSFPKTRYSGCWESRLRRFCLPNN